MGATKIFLRVVLMLALAAALPACRDANNDDDQPTPTPTATPQPTATPDDGGDTVDDGSGDDGSTDDGSTDPTPTPTPASSASGAAMTFSQERVTALEASTTNGTASTLSVQRPNGEVWRLQIDGVPAILAGNTLLYENPALVFGGTQGTVVFPEFNGTRYGVVLATRIR